MFASILILCLATAPQAPATPAQELAKLKANVMSADYRGDLAELARLRDELAKWPKDRELAYLAEFKSEALPWEGERVIEKHTNIAFIGTGLERELHESAIAEVVITGVITNNSVEATARMTGNLGFTTYVVSDATATFGRRDFAGRWRTADEVQAMSLANLSGEYAIVSSTQDLLVRFASRIL